MKAFLNTLAVYLTEKFGETLEEQHILFPNRRAGVFFRHYLQQALPGSAWLPKISTINSFMEELSGLSYADPIDLNFDLYSVYNGLVAHPEPYDEFYYWGEMMISDFNDIDKYLVNAGDLFRNLSDLKEIDNIFDYLSPEQKELIYRFWSHFDSKDLSREQQSFLGIWKILYPLYTGFREVLGKKKTGYEGMIYREVAECIERRQYPEMYAAKVIICGFNALSAAERKLFRHLRNSGTGEFYWDYDRQYSEGKIAEAGRFIRRNLEEFPSPNDFPEDFNGLSKPKNIRIFNLPSDVLQTKKLHEILSEREMPPASAFHDTAVILGDEDLLQPVLTSLPAGLPGLNITMGYPLKNTPVFSFIDNLLRLQRNISSRTGKKGERFYYRDVLSVLNHQYTGAILGDAAKAKSADINNRNMIYIDPAFFQDNELFTAIFRRTRTAPEMIAYLSDLLDILLREAIMPEEGGDRFLLEKEFIFHIRTRLNKLGRVFASAPPEAGFETFIRLFRKLMNNSRIPFEGEPLQGIQVMGILETRLLDFTNLVFLSLNDGVMPASGNQVSCIPANLRYAFGIPTREDKDAIYAYYFYRLLQRAEHVDIMYNSRTNGLSSGEPGRYIYQLKYLFDYNIRFGTVSFRIGERTPVPITIPKTAEVMAALSAFKGGGSRNLSPTSVTTYLDCPLRFYFTYIAGMREEEEVSEDIDAPVFGILLHKTMELLYKPYLGRELTTADLNTIMQEGNIRKRLDQAFSEEYYRDGDPQGTAPEGRNIIVYEVIRKMVEGILQKDRGNTPFRIMALEEKVEVLLETDDVPEGIRIGGTIDRREERGEGMHILDYKTGRVENAITSVARLFERDTWPANGKYRAVLQTFIYSWIYSRKTEYHVIRPGLVVAGKIFGENYTPDIIFKEGREVGRPLSNFREIGDEFGEHFVSLLTGLFSPDVPFIQTDDEKRCVWCPYAAICHRSAKSW